MKYQELIKCYKPLVAVKDYHPEVLTNYMSQNYDCIDRTEDYKHTFHFKTLMENLYQYYNLTQQQAPVYLEVVNNQKSMKLYDSLDSSDINPIYVFIDKESGFFETPSFDLNYELTLEKGVSQKSYEEETLELIDALNSIKSYMRYHFLGCYSH